MFINDEKIGDLAVEVVGQIHVAVKRDYCFFFNFKSILHKKHIILCSTEYLLHKKTTFFYQYHSLATNKNQSTISYYC